VSSALRAGGAVLAVVWVVVLVPGAGDDATRGGRVAQGVSGC